MMGDGDGEKSQEPLWAETQAGDISPQTLDQNKCQACGPDQEWIRLVGGFAGGVRNEKAEKR